MAGNQTIGFGLKKNNDYLEKKVDLLVMKNQHYRELASASLQRLEQSGKEIARLEARIEELERALHDVLGIDGKLRFDIITICADALGAAKLPKGASNEVPLFNKI